MSSPPPPPPREGEGSWVTKRYKRNSKRGSTGMDEDEGGGGAGGEGRKIKKILGRVAAAKTEIAAN
jgi:hypothetical protein